jgi:integrase
MPDDTVRLAIHRSKANKTSGLPEFVFLQAEPHDVLNGYNCLRAYWTDHALHNFHAHQPLFPALPNKDTPFSVSEYRQFLESALTRLGYTHTDYSPHSLRSGGATDLFTRHFLPPKDVQQLGRWASDAFWIYLRDNPHVQGVQIAAALAKIINI